MDVYIISDSQSFNESTASDQATPHDPSLTTRSPVSHGAKGSQMPVATLPSVLLVVVAFIALSS